MSSAPIGIFDSGIGGLTIYHELVKMLPKEQFIYLADSNHAPYGERPPEDIERFSFVNSQFLIDKGCKLIVVACNTATTIAVKKLRQSFQVPFIGIEPAIKPAALQSSRKKVGVLATRGTLNSTLFQETYQRFGQDVETTIQVGKGLVELIEAGKKNSVEMTALLQKHLQPINQEDRMPISTMEKILNNVNLVAATCLGARDQVLCNNKATKGDNGKGN